MSIELKLTADSPAAMRKLLMEIIEQGNPDADQADLFEAPAHPAQTKTASIPTVDTSAAPAVDGGTGQKPEVDAKGFKWDARCHSSNQKLTAKGVWQKRKGISDDEREAIENEQLGIFETPTPTEPVVEAPVEPEVVVEQPVAHPPANMPFPVPEQPATPEPAPAPQLEQIDFNGLMMLMSQVAQSGKMTQDRVNDMNTRLGVGSINEVMGDQAKIDQAQVILTEIANS